jgi:tetratricopeptide (TPR) repeat protein
VEYHWRLMAVECVLSEVVLLPEMSQIQAEEVLEMFAEGEGLESVNTSLALHLVELARDLGRDALVARLLDHAAKVSVNPEDQGWCQFELLKHQGASKDELIGLGITSEKEGLPGLAAGIFHHVSLLSLGSDDAAIFANRSMRLRDEAEDVEGMIYGHALLAHIAKEDGDFEESQLHLRKRLELIPESEKFERMEAIADLAHSHSTLGDLEQAQALLIDSLGIAIELDELSGILVARWGLADLAEISNQPDEAMVQLSDAMTAFMDAGEAVPELVIERISKLTAE